MESVLERFVLAALQDRLPPHSTPPVLPVEKGRTPRLLALDLLAWISLGKAHYGKPGAPDGAAEALAAIRAATATGTLVVPISGMNLGEVAQRGDETSRRNLARFMVELSRNCSLVNELHVATEEFELGIRRLLLGEEPRYELRPTLLAAGVAAAVFGRGPMPEWPPEVRTQMVALLGEERVAQLFEQANNHPEISAEIIVGSHNPNTEHREARRTSEEDTVRQVTELRTRRHGTSEAALVRDEVEHIMLKEHLFHSVLERLGLTDAVVQRLLTEEPARSLLRACPGLHVMLTLLIAVNRNLSLQFQTGDYRDFTLLQATIAYADIVVTENRWAALAREDLKTLPALLSS